MKRNICFPDYNNSIMNLSCSVMQAFGAKPKHPILKHRCLENINNKENIVFLILDGLGAKTLIDYAKKNDSILFKNMKTTITSVFPPTTAAAITTFRTAQSPLEHGIIGWSLYFKELGTMIDLLPMVDSLSKMPLAKEDYPVMEYLGIRSIGEKIKAGCYDILPEEHRNSYYNTQASKGFKRIFYSSFDEMVKAIALLSKKKGRKLISSYSQFPDKVIHHEGVRGKNVNKTIRELEKGVKALAKRLEGTNSVLIITADHGLIDCKKTITINDYPKLSECMILPRFPEPRFVSFFIKDDKKKQFEKEVSKFKKDFLVLTREEFFRKKLLGTGIKHKKVDDFIGDYVMIGIGDAQIRQEYPQQKDNHSLIAHHAGLTREEMVVPLIVINFEKKKR